MIGIRRSAARYPRWLLLVIIGASQIFGSSRAARSEEIEFISKLGAFEKAGGHVSEYKVNQEDHLLDLSIIPTTPLAGGEAGTVGRDTCSLGRRTVTNLTHAWTVRAFVPEEATPAYTSEIPAVPSIHEHRKRASAGPGPRRVRTKVVRIRQAPRTAAARTATRGDVMIERPQVTVPRTARRR